jgi:hypothetical protein
MHGTGIICAQLAAFVLGGEEVIDHVVGQGGELAQFLPGPACQATCMPFLPGSRSWPREEHDCAALACARPGLHCGFGVLPVLFAARGVDDG